MINKLFDCLEVAHDHTAHACSTLGTLSQSLDSNQLLLLLRASVRPMVQIKSLPGFLNEPSMSHKMELPEKKMQRIETLMIPDQISIYITPEKPKSPTHLLAATLALKILNKFVDGITQCKIQKIYAIRPKQLATCISG